MKILAVDFDGALLKSRPFSTAHKDWFKVMSVLLKDESINEYAGAENYFDYVDEVMERYLGSVNKDSRTKFARELFSLVTVGQITQGDLVKDFPDYLKTLKGKYKIALITSAPEDSVTPILEKLGVLNLFDFVYKSPSEKRPNKKELFEEFISKYEKPDFYIGKGDKDIESIKEMGIKTISVKWVSKGEFKGDYDVDSVQGLKEILE